jgi:hypothetical protein
MSKLNYCESIYFSLRIVKSLSIKLSHLLSKLLNRCVSDVMVISQVNLKLPRLYCYSKITEFILHLTEYDWLEALKLEIKTLQMMLHIRCIY